jgi:predicted N-acyltransferase
VTEYFPSPRSAEPDAIVAGALERMRSERAAFVILKDIPRDSPLLSKEENEAAADLRHACRRAGFVIVAGQALAYVPVDPTSEDAYLAGLSRARRKDLRRKLRGRSSLDIEEHATGDRVFDDEAFVEELIRLYRNVYDQSLIHFDELTSPFLKEVFRTRGGTLFVYRQHGKLIGHNLCFVHRDRLVDKYVGFAYPQARAANLYFVSWFHNLEWARRRRLTTYVAGWTDPEVKRSLGARFTFTDHAVFPRHKVLRGLLRTTRRWFESDANLVAATER